MNSTSTGSSEKKIAPASQALEKGIQAFDAKNFVDAIKCCELGMRLAPEAKDKYPLLNCLTSSKASICFFKQEYRQALDHYSKTIEEIENDLKLLNNEFKSDDISDSQRIEISILIATCKITLGFLHARRCQISYFIDETAEAAIDYGHATLYKMGKYATKLRHVTSYVVNNLNKLPQNKNLQNDVSLFSCAEKYWDGVTLYAESKFSESIPYFVDANQSCQDVPDILEHLADAKLAAHFLCKSREEKMKLMAEIIDHASQFITHQSLSKMFLIRGIAYTMKEEFLLGYNDFVLAMQKEILVLGKFDEQMWPLVENSLQCFIFCQLQLIKKHQLSPEFLAEEKSIQVKIDKDNYRYIHQVVMKLAAICKEKQELEIARNLYCFALWISHRLKMPELDSPSVAAYLSCVIPSLQAKVNAITSEEVDHLKKLLFRLSEKKRGVIKKLLNEFAQTILDHSQQLLEANKIESAKEFYNYVQMIQPENSAHYKLALAQIEKLKISEQKPIKQKKKKEKIPLAVNPMPVIEDAKKVVFEVKPILPNKEIRSVSPIENPIEKTEISLPVTCELELKHPIAVPAAFWVITYCLQAVGVKQIYAIGETLCGPYFPQGFNPQIEIVFGDVNPTEAIKKAFPEKSVVQEDCYYRIAMHDNYCVTFRNSEPMNNVAKMLEQKDLSKYDIKKLKYEGILQDVKQLNSFTLFSIYVECDEDKLVGYDPKQRGFNDLCRKRLKCIGETSKTVANDPCVALKTIYYSQVWDIEIPQTLTDSIVELKQGDLAAAIEKNPARINEAISRLFLNGSALINFEQLRKLKLLEKIVPEFALFSDSTDQYAQAILLYLQCVLKGCDAIVFEQSAEHKPEFNLIYATWEYAIQLLRKHPQCNNSYSHYGTLFNRSFSNIPGETRRRLLLSAENKWKFNFFNIVPHEMEPTTKVVDLTLQ